MSTVTPKGKERKGRISDGAYCPPSGVIISYTSIPVELAQGPCEVPSDESMNARWTSPLWRLLHLLPHWSIFRKPTNIPVDCQSPASYLTTVLTCPVGNNTLLMMWCQWSPIIWCWHFIWHAASFCVIFEQHPCFTSRTEINRMLYRCSLVLRLSLTQQLTVWPLHYLLVYFGEFGESVTSRVCKTFSWLSDLSLDVVWLLLVVNLSSGHLSSTKMCAGPLSE